MRPFLRPVARLVLASLFFASLMAQESSLTMVRCGRLLDVRNGRLLVDQVVLVSGNRIAAVGPFNAMEVPPGANLVDLSQATVLPGLFDVHTHLVDDAESTDLARPLRKTGAQMAFESIPNAVATLRAGFTSVRDLGTFRALVDVALGNAIERGIVPGPRIQPAGAYVTISGGAGALTGFAPDLVLPLDLRFGVADGADQVRQRVRELVRNGVGVIKVLATGAVLTLGSQPGAQEFSRQELQAAVEEASKAGLKVACHAHGTAGALDAVEAGVASIEHGSFLSEEVLLRMKERGVFLVPDLYNDAIILAGHEKGLPEEFVEKERVAGESQRATFRNALKMGVKIAYGTDAAVIPHGDNGRQFATYVENGMAPLAAIRSATLNAAELMGWQDRLGSIEPGKLADLIAVSGNPLETVHELERVIFVMKDGKVIKP